MQRLFAEHAVRFVQSLDGLWTLRAGDREALPVFVPGVWDQIPSLADYRGRAEYTRKVRMDKEGNYVLRFGGVSHTARVGWDGETVGGHYNAFTGFDVVLLHVPVGEHTLTVEVDDSFSEASALHIPNDYYTYGGISRPVELHRVGGAYLENMAFHALRQGEGKYLAHVRVCVKALEDTEDMQLTVSLAGQSVQVPVLALSAGGHVEVETAISAEGIHEWNVGDGSLYTLCCVLTDGTGDVDDLMDRVGFRTVEVKDGAILLNGRRVRIKGFNRHEDHGLFGVSLPAEAMAQDLQLLLDMGGNAVRTSHYPNDPRFLDLCDELGILVWEEAHARAVPADIFFSDRFMAQCRACNEEMVAQHVNHPSIFVWGLLNECESETEKGRGVYAAQLAQLRSLDPTRPVSFASCRHFTDICLDLVDIVSFNVYPKWYLDEDVASYLKRLENWMDGNGACGKPILITEIGAGAIAGFHDMFHRAKWSEERQADILTEQLQAVHADTRLSGSFIWQFADVRVSESWAMSRPKTMNNKGIVDDCRHPKAAYLTVREIYRGLPSLE